MSTIYLPLLLKEKSYKQTSANMRGHKTLVSCRHANSKVEFSEIFTQEVFPKLHFKRPKSLCFVKTATYVWARTT